MMFREFVGIFIFLIISDQFMNSYSKGIGMNSEVDTAEDAEMDDVPKQASLKSEIFYDHFLLTLNWPQTNCYLYQHRKLRMRMQAIQKNCSECNMPSDRYKWTIHGLWPSNNKLLWTPEAKGTIHFCKKQKDTYKIKAGTPLAKALDTLLITFGRNDNVILHLHQWNKHGTCVKDREDMNSQEKYFEKTLKLYNKYDPSQFLKDVKIVPGKSYTMEKLVNVLKEFLNGATPKITCVETVEGQQFIHEIRICLDRHFLEPIDCETLVNPDAPTLGVCDERYNIIVPENKSPCPGRRSIS